MFSAGHRARGVLAVFVLLSLFTAGCVDFEKQTIVAAFPDNSPEVRVLLVYEGIGIKGDKPDDLKKAREQFTKFVMKNQEFCIFGNWLFRFDLVAKDDDGPDTQRHKAFLRNHLQIRNGKMYRNKEGKLSGYQTVTIRDGNKFVKELNSLVSGGFSSVMKESGARSDEDFDLETIRMIHDSAKQDFQWFTLEPGRASFTLPATAQTIRRVKSKFLKELKRDDEDAEFLARTPLSFHEEYGRFTISLGVGSGQPIQVETSPDKILKHDMEIAKLAEELKVPFRSELDTAALVDEFVKNKGKP